MSAAGVSAGGLAFLVPRHRAQQPVPDHLKPACVLHSIVPGRAAALHVSSPAREHSMCISNVHNHHLLLSTCMKSNVSGLSKSRLQQCMSAPL
eukprot:2913774-Pyramimonas_sp.AAC.1